MNSRPKFRNVATPLSVARFAIWRLTGRCFELILSTRDGVRTAIRPGNTNDYCVFYDTFVSQVYTPPWPIPASQIRHVVDIGGNIGTTVLDWRRRFPTAHITVYEPHPIHVSRIERHLKLNGIESDVTVRPVAAGVARASAQLSDDGWASAVGAPTSSKSIPVKIVDLFGDLADIQPDFVKLDCEGGEYDILADRRFEQMKPKYIVLEAHPDPRYSDGPGWCRERLNRLGYETLEFPHVLWGHRHQS
jgi:FkbM family methyltransferase